MKISRTTLRSLVVCATAFGGAAAPVLVAAGLAAPAVLTGCKKKAPPAPPPPPPPPPAKPPAPDPINIDSVMQSAKPDPRVQFPQGAAPTDASLATAIVAFSNALVKGDSDAFASHLSSDSKNDLASLVSSGEWEASTAKLEAVRVVGTDDLAPSGDGAMTAARVTLAVQEPGEAYTLSWTARKKGSAWEFDGAASTDGIKRRASDWDAGGSTAADSGSSSPTAAAAPAAGGGGQDLSAVFTWAKKEMERRVASASKNSGIATPAPAAPPEIATALTAGITPKASDVKTLVDLGMAKAAEGGNVVNQDKVFQYASQILKIGEPTVRALYEGKDAGGTVGGGSTDTSKPAAEKPQAKVSLPGAIPNVSPLRVVMFYELHMRVSQTTVAGRADGGATVYEMADAWGVKPDVVNQEMTTGQQQKQEKFLLTPAECYSFVKERREAYKDVAAVSSNQDIFAFFEQITGQPKQVWSDLYDAGKAAAKGK